MKAKQPPLSDLVSIRPSAIVELEGIVTRISIEWYESNKNSVKLIGYSLILLTKEGEQRYIDFEDFNSMMEKARQILENRSLS